MHQFTRRQQGAARTAPATDHDQTARAVDLHPLPVAGLSRGPTPIIQRVSKAEKKRRDARRAAAAAAKAADKGEEPAEAAAPEPEPEAEAAEAEAGPAAATGPTTPAEAAHWLWHQDSTFQHTMAAKSFKLKHFSLLPQVRDLVPDAAALALFRTAWAQLQAASPVAQAAVGQQGPQSITAQVLAHMNSQYKDWNTSDGSVQTRGAWWGTATFGSKKGAQAIPKAALDGGLKAQAAKLGWVFKDSWSGGLSFHKTGKSGVDFIYHYKA